MAKITIEDNILFDEEFKVFVDNNGDMIEGTIDLLQRIMKTSRSVDAWNKNCNLVKQSCDGKYPDIWYKAIIESGIAKDMTLYDDYGIKPSWFK